ncbi:hypothetical protein [Undibacterium rugosum]|uniref:hypothetical protein n=1 Tax=Undibacterium rugosum TaxID=2762291 RepID=UPI001B818E42|nr:hypothetical protein [Undibacterium rugosum]MBR7778915.1 hypothetical protein [Undibacterium rugosum]
MLISIKSIKWLPAAIVLLSVVAMLWHGPVLQLPHYHEFADQRVWLGIPHAADVLSNLGFALVAALAGDQLFVRRRYARSAAALPAFSLLCLIVFLTAVVSAYYHLAPDDARLFWDRMAIALASACLICGVRADAKPGMTPHRALLELMLGLILAVASVLWWRHSADLRPYLLLQLWTVLLVIVWQGIWQADHRIRRWFNAAIACYLLAKLAEMADHTILSLSTCVSGHSLKHLIAAGAAACIFYGLRQACANPVR